MSLVQLRQKVSSFARLMAVVSFTALRRNSYRIRNYYEFSVWRNVRIILSLNISRSLSFRRDKKIERKRERKSLELRLEIHFGLESYNTERRRIRLHDRVAKRRSTLGMRVDVSRMHRAKIVGTRYAPRWNFMKIKRKEKREEKRREREVEKKICTNDIGVDPR